MEKFFKLKQNGTNVKTELVAGLTTFLTMAYIIAVNPNILSLAMGGDIVMKGSIFVATILAAVIGTLIMGLVANVPFAQAPGMGLNAFFTFTVCFGMGIKWEQALGIVFVCGLINIIITVTSIRKMLIKAVPETLQYAIGGGIGLFIAYIGLKDAKFIQFTVDVPKTALDLIGKTGSYTAEDAIPAISSFQNPVTVVALLGIIITVIFMLRKMKSSILLGIVATTIIGIFIGTDANGHMALGIPFVNDSIKFVTDLTPLKDFNMNIPSLAPTFGKLDLSWMFDIKTLISFLPIVLAFSLADTFDTIGTFLGTGKKTGIFDDKDEKALAESKGFKSKLEKALFADATATSIGAVLGTSNTTTYIESASGIEAGGRTGLTSVVVAILFLLCLPFSVIIGLVPLAATAPALVIVGILMMTSIARVKWNEFEEAAAAFFTAVIMPFTFNIANGVAFGFLFYIIAKITKGKAKDIHPIMYIVTLLFVLQFVLKATGVIK